MPSCRAVARRAKAGGPLPILFSTIFIGFLIWQISKPLRSVATFSDELAIGAREINNASGEVSNTSQLLAEGSSQQASSIEESSASLQEIKTEMAEEVNAQSQRLNEISEELALIILGAKKNTSVKELETY